ncbi:NAD(P)-dependent oxidoreductase [Cohnella nanjingensis]|uniref:NAD(P)-dependent oxidoreductase n=1 Tax=Cohnella nanjingensis TaxID=1387779 RepID=UPI0024834CCF|nr:NAD(P)-binding domain-containing protein [Cohnella nanjingensis]
MHNQNQQSPSPSIASVGTRTPVTIVGLGPMGRALAGAFLRAGHPTTVWNRSPGKADDLAAQGAYRADRIADAVAASPLVIVCVLNDDAVHAILEPVAAALKGRTLVNLTADSPARARGTAAWAAEHGIDYVDGAIMTPTPTIGTPAASVLYSGSSDAFEAVRPALASIGGAVSHLGDDPGRAAAFDVALLDLFWTSMSGYVHALALARTENIPARELAVHAQGIVRILPAIMTSIADQVDAGRYPGDSSNLLSAAAGMTHILHAARHHGLDTSVLTAAKAIAQRAIDAGHGTEGFSRLVEEIRQPSV